MTESDAGTKVRDDAPDVVTVLVVDDAAVDRRMAGAIIERELGWRVVYAGNGRAALAAIEREKPRVVLTDLQMPEMDGLELVVAVREKHPLTPVVLMTGVGNEEIASRALREGAASFVPKKVLESDLAAALEQVVDASKMERRQQLLLESLTRCELEFALENDTALVPAIVSHLQQYILRLGLCDPTGVIRLGVAMQETVLNAMYHGNLEVSSDLRQDGEEPFHRLAEERRKMAPYKNRRVFCTVKLSPEELVYVIRDEGPGFNPAELPDPSGEASMERVGGRGLVLIRTFMDEVAFNDKGNEITLVKRRDRGPERPRSWPMQPTM